MKRKLVTMLSMVLTGAMLFGLAGCGGSGGSNSDNADNAA